MMRRFAWCGTTRSIASAPDAGLGEHVRGGLAHAADRALEDLLAVEVPHGVAEADFAVRVGRAVAAHAQDRARVAVAAELVGEQALVAVGRLQHDRRAAVAEQHRDVAVVPVHERRDRLDADHQRVAHRARPDHARGRRDAVQEARARGVEVHRRAFQAPSRYCRPDAVLGTASSLEHEP
jgi:hypothetical protein